MTPTDGAKPSSHAHEIKVVNVKKVVLRRSVVVIQLVKDKLNYLKVCTNCLVG